MTRASAFSICSRKEKVCDYIARHVDAGRIFVGCEGEEPDIAHAIKAARQQTLGLLQRLPARSQQRFCKHEINEMLENPDISEADKAAVLHGNARRFYNLGAPGL